jgi:hypothetical protein
MEPCSPPDHNLSQMIPVHIFNIYISLKSIFNNIFLSTYLVRGRDSSVDIAMSYGLDGPSLIPGMESFSFLHSVQTDSGERADSYPKGKAARA